MNFRELIEKTVAKKRGYKYHTYKTDYDDIILKLYHYGTKILELDTKAKKVLRYHIWGFSDQMAISRTLWILQFPYYTYSGRIWYRINAKGVWFSIPVEYQDRAKQIVKILRLFSTKDLYDLSWIRNIWRYLISVDVTKSLLSRVLKKSRAIKQGLEHRREIIGTPGIKIFKNGVLCVSEYFYHTFFILFDSDTIYQNTDIAGWGISLRKNNIIVTDNFKWYNMEVDAERFMRLDDDDRKIVLEMLEKHPNKERILDNLLIQAI